MAWRGSFRGPAAKSMASATVWRKQSEHLALLLRKVAPLLTNMAITMPNTMIANTIPAGIVPSRAERLLRSRCHQPFPSNRSTGGPSK